MPTAVRLAICSLILVGATAYMAYLGASSGWTYYVTVDECLEQLDALKGSRVRVSGTVAEGSLVVARDRRSATFRIAGQAGSMAVRCRGFVPETLTEGRPVVVEGQINRGGTIEATQVLTRCASKYEASNASGSSSAVRRE